MRYARVKLVPTPEAEHCGGPFYFDVLLDSEDRLYDDQPIFGCQGILSGTSDEYYPVCVRSNGHLDYGAAYDSVHRRGRCNLRDVIIRDGQLVNCEISGTPNLKFRISFDAAIR